MEQKNQDQDSELKVLTERLHTLFSKTANETVKTRVSGRVRSVYKTLINLHNQRFYYDFTRTKGFQLTPGLFKYPTKKWSGDVTIKLINAGSTWQVLNFMGCNLYIRKNTIEVRYKPGAERWHYLEHGEKGTKDYVNVMMANNNACKLVIKAFIERWGGNSSLKLINVYHHCKGMGDDTINKIPKSFKFGNNVVQKAYNEHNIEFLNPQAAMNYLTTEGVKDHLPTLCNAIDGLSNAMQTINPLRALKLLTKHPSEAIHYPGFIQELTEHEKRVLCDYYFKCAELKIYHS